MRVLVAPDTFGGTLSALETAAAIVRGWRRGAPHDEVSGVALSDGGAGFVDVLHAALGGQLRAVTVTGPAGAPAPATVLVSGDTAYVEAAQACGPHLLDLDGAHRGDVGALSTRGVGELVRAAIEAEVARVVVGVGACAAHDGGAGLLAGLGAEPDGLLAGGGESLARLESVDLDVARAVVDEVELVVATDVDNPLLGVRGATTVYGPVKGLTPSQVRELELGMIHYARLVDEKAVGMVGAGAGGGLAYALLALGARRVAGVGLTVELAGLDSAVATAELVVTGEATLDWQSLRGKVVAGVAERAARRGVPVVVLAERVEVGRREMQSLGVESAYALADLPGIQPTPSRAQALLQLAERVARGWSPARNGR